MVLLWQRSGRVGRRHDYGLDFVISKQPPAQMGRRLYAYKLYYLKWRFPTLWNAILFEMTFSNNKAILVYG